MKRDNIFKPKSSSFPKPVHIVAGVVGVMVILYVMSGSSPASGGAGLVDMHSHTTESDGDRTAEEQIDLASNIGISSFWITDHDMIRTPERTHEIQGYANSKGIDVGFGVEITVGWVKKEHHLLGYFPDVAWKGNTWDEPMKYLQKACAEVKESRENRNQMMVKFMNSVLKPTSGEVYFTDKRKHASFEVMTVRGVEKWAVEFANLLEPTSLGRPHFRKYLIEKVGVREDVIFGPRDGDGIAIVNSEGAFYGKEKEGKSGKEIAALMHSATLAKHNIAFVPMPIEDAIRAIREAGGRAVIAHIPTLGPGWYQKFSPTFDDLKKAGLWGIEAFSSEIDKENHLLIHDLADKHGLVMTGGSDNHGNLKVYAKLGSVHRAGTEAYTEMTQWAKTAAQDQSNAIHQNEF